MEARTILLSEASLTDFLSAYTVFHHRWSGADEDNSVAVCLLDKLDDRWMPSPEKRDLGAEQVENGGLVFLPLHDRSPNGDPPRRVQELSAADLKQGPTLIERLKTR